jgi:hypothetical protein
MDTMMLTKLMDLVEACYSLRDYDEGFNPSKTSCKDYHARLWEMNDNQLEMLKQQLLVEKEISGD